MRELNHLISEVGELDAGAMAMAAERQDQLTKPPGSLGVLEQLSIRLAGITGKVENDLANKVVVVMAADHGVAAEGVSAYPAEVTEQMVYNFSRGGAAINVLAEHEGARVVVVDIGVKADINCPGVLSKKVRPGTANLATGPAMTRNQAIEAVMTGARLAIELISEGADLIATGDMGIGNTTASSAMVAALSGLDPEKVVGRGTGISEETLKTKTAIISQAIELNRVDAGDPVDVLGKVGGLEIAGLSGVILGCAARRKPVVIDGFISSAAALAAAKLAPKSVNYMFGSHLSVEPGHALALGEIGLSPMLHMDMRLGEGTGAVLAMNLITAAAKLISNMATFAEAGVSVAETLAGNPIE